MTRTRHHLSSSNTRRRPLIELSTATTIQSLHALRPPSSPLANAATATAGASEEARRLFVVGRSVNRAGRAGSRAAYSDALITRLALLADRRTRPVSPSHYRSNLVEATAAAVPIGHDRVGRAGGPVGRWRVIWRREAAAAAAPARVICRLSAPSPSRRRRCPCCDAEACCWCCCTAAVSAGCCRLSCRAVDGECSAWLRSQINCGVVSALRPVQFAITTTCVMASLCTDVSITITSTDLLRFS